MKKIKKKRVFYFGIFVGLLLLVACFCDKLCPYDPYLQDLGNAKAAPSFSHPFGTDRYGRDMLSRVLIGSRSSIFSAIFLSCGTALLGTAVGIFAAWRGKKTEAVLMRVSDMFLAFPTLVFAMAAAAMLGGGMKNAVFALLLVGWPKYARLARSQTLVQKECPYVKAAILSGCHSWQLLMFHILPNIAGSILVTAVLDIGTMLMELAGLSFLGLGAKAPAAEWGSMMSETRGLLSTHPWVTFAPGIAIFITVMIFHVFGDALRDLLDPRNEG